MKLALCGSITAALLMFAQEPVVSRSRIWVDTVQRGDVPVGLRAAGVLSGNRAAELRVPEREAKRIETGQSVTVEIQKTPVPGRIARVGPAAPGGLVRILVDLEGPVPEPVRPGQPVNGIVQVGTLSDVLHVGRPVACIPGGEGVLFKLSADGGSAAKVKVLYGQASFNRVEIRSGLEPGDKVILSDMSAYSRDDRVLLK